MIDDATSRLYARFVRGNWISSTDLASILSHVETRQVKGNYTVSVDGRHYVIDKDLICTGLRGGNVPVEQRLDSTMAMRFKDRCRRSKPARSPLKRLRQQSVTLAKAIRPNARRRAGKARMNGFRDKPSRCAGYRPVLHNTRVRRNGRGGHRGLQSG
jgi:hypothetical protein